MAKLTVEYRCGHEMQEVRFGGKYSEQLEYAKDHLDCPECYRASQSHMLQTQVTDLELPTLSGSEKQVTWANDIRAKLMLDFKDLIKQDNPKHVALWDALIAKTEARWWIDRRDQSWKDVFKEVATAEGLI